MSRIFFVLFRILVCASCPDCLLVVFVYRPKFCQQEGPLNVQVQAKQDKNDNLVAFMCGGCCILYATNTPPQGIFWPWHQLQLQKLYQPVQQAQT